MRLEDIDPNEVIATYATVTDSPPREAPWADVPEARPRARFRSKDVTKSVTAVVTIDGVLHYDPKTTEYHAYPQASPMAKEAETWEYTEQGKVIRI